MGPAQPFHAGPLCWRRSVRGVDGTLTLADGTVRHLDDKFLLVPLERALRAMSWGLVTLATGLALARLT